MIVRGWFIETVDPTKMKIIKPGPIISIELLGYNIAFTLFHDFIIHDEKKKKDYVATVFTDTESGLPDAFRVIEFLPDRPIPKKKEQKQQSKPAPTTTKPKAKGSAKKKQ